MIKIAHRGNFAGKNSDKENFPDYIEAAIAAGYDVEVDAWLLADTKVWMLGHDFPKYEVPLSFFQRPQIWTHAKNLIGYVSLYNDPKCHVFWHNKDEFTFTSKGIKWANFGIETSDGVMVLPENDPYLRVALTKGQIEPLGICCDNFSFLEK